MFIDFRHQNYFLYLSPVPYVSVWRFGSCAFPVPELCDGGAGAGLWFMGLRFWCTPGDHQEIHDDLSQHHYLETIVYFYLVSYLYHKVEY